MIASEARTRDMRLLTLLIHRAMDEDACDASILGADCMHMVADRRYEGRQVLEVRLELLKGLPARIIGRGGHCDRPTVQELCGEAEEIASSIGALWRARADINAMLAEVTTAVRREIAKAKRRDIHYRVESVAICPIESGNTQFPYVHVQLARLSAALTSEIVTLEFEDADQVKPAFGEMFDSQKARRMRQIVLQAAGADGEIDEVALRFMKMQGCDVPVILANLPQADFGILDVDLPKTDGCQKMVLFWRDGIVQANVELTGSVRWWEGRVSFKEAPKRFPAQPQGRLLSDFIKHDALPDDLRIISGYRSGDSASAYVPIKTAKFNSETGEAWAA